MNDVAGVGETFSTWRRSLSRRDPRAWSVVLIGLLLTTVAINLALRQAGYATTLRYLRMMAMDQATADSWRPMLRAIDAWDRGRPIYQTVFFDERVKFQYPLTSLLLPLALRSDTRKDISLMKALNHVSLAIFALFVAACVSAFLAVWLDRPIDWGSRITWIGAAAIALSAVFFYPALMAYVLGQIQTVVNTAVAVALVAWVCGRRALAGAAIGLACLVKPHVGIFLVWGVLRKAWSFTASLIVVVAIGGAISVALFGWHENLAYGRVVAYLAEHGEALYANQSVNGLLNRLVQPLAFRGWDFHAFPPSQPVVRMGTLLAAVILLGAALVLPVVLRFSGTVVDLAIMALSITAASPIAWDHHYGVLLPILILAGGFAMRSPSAPPWMAGALAAAALVTGLLWEPLILVDRAPWNIVQSYVFAGAMLALFVLYRLGVETAVPGRLVGD
jgi:alpha-1,2-mannosyltransferase